MSAYDQNLAVLNRLTRRGINATIQQASILRRAEKTLHRWAEMECGGGNDYASWAIERDETTGTPYRVTYPHRGNSYRVKIADKEAAALRRVRHLCAHLKLDCYHQTDPRGCALYVSAEPLTDQNYSTAGVACAV